MLISDFVIANNQQQPGWHLHDSISHKCHSIHRYTVNNSRMSTFRAFSVEFYFSEKNASPNENDKNVRKQRDQNYSA